MLWRDDMRLNMKYINVVFAQSGCDMADRKWPMHEREKKKWNHCQMMKPNEDRTFHWRENPIEPFAVATQSTNTRNIETFPMSYHMMNITTTFGVFPNIFHRIHFLPTENYIRRMNRGRGDENPRTKMWICGLTIFSWNEEMCPIKIEMKKQTISEIPLSVIEINGILLRTKLPF